MYPFLDFRSIIFCLVLTQVKPMVIVDWIAPPYLYYSEE
jgi:hypothetical protein